MSSRARPPSAKPRSRGSMDSSYSSRGGGHHHDEKSFMLDCKAAYCVVYDDLTDEIKSKSQLSKVLQQAGRTPTRKMLAKYWTEDTETLSFEEFIDICRKEKATTEEELIKAFRKVDLNGDGYISNSELRKMLCTKGDPMTADEVQTIIDEVDENGDGVLDYKEFCKMLLKTQEEVKSLAIKKMERRGNKKSHSHKNGSRLGSQTSLRDSAMGSRVSLRSERHSQMGSSVSIKSEIKEDILANSPPTSARSRRRSSQISVHSTKSPGTPISSRRASRISHRVSDNEDEIEEDISSGGDSEGEMTPRQTQDGNVTPAAEESSSDDDIIVSTKAIRSKKEDVSADPPVPKPRKSLLASAEIKSHKSQRKDDATPSHSPRQDSTRQAISSLDLKLPRPKRIRDWEQLDSKGCFFFDEDGSIDSHQYELDVTQDTSVYITAQPISIRPGADLNAAREMGRSPIDIILFLLREDNSVVTFSEQRDEKGKFAIRCDVDEGTYRVVPFTTGCRFKYNSKDDNEEIKLLKKRDDKFQFTKPFREALSDIFDMCDLDGNGTLSREEFNFYNLRTSGEEVGDDEWAVVEDNVDMENGELSKQGFIQLVQMEADDNEGDTGDLWVNLSSMGFNKALKNEQACPFLIEVYSEGEDVKLKPVELVTGGSKLEKAVIDSTIAKGERSKIRNMNDLFIHKYISDFRACIVVENRSRSRVTLRLDCSRSQNCVSHRDDLDYTIEIPPRSSVVGHHLLPKKETREWSIRCNEIVIK